MSTPHEPGDGKQQSSPPSAADKRPGAAGTPAKPGKPERPAQKSSPGPQGNGQGAPAAPTAGKPARVRRPSSLVPVRNPPRVRSRRMLPRPPPSGARTVRSRIPSRYRRRRGSGDSSRRRRRRVPTDPRGRKPPASRRQGSTGAARRHGHGGPQPPQGDGRPARPVVTGTAAPKPAAPKPPAADRRDVAKAKAAAIDGPTRSIARTDLAKDMPDLSAVPRQRPASGSARKAALTAAVTEEVSRCGPRPAPPDRPVVDAQGVAGDLGGAVLRVDCGGRSAVPRARRMGCGTG